MKTKVMAVLFLLLAVVCFAGQNHASAEGPYTVIFCYANTGCQVMYPLMPANTKIVLTYTNLYHPPHIVYQDTKHFPFVPPAPQPYKQPALNLFK